MQKWAIEKHRAIVIDNLDPLEAGRVRARIPGLLDFEQTEQYPWIYCLSPFPGIKDSGSFIIPEIGEYVIVERPNALEYYWVGTWVSSDSKPVESTTVEKKTLYKSKTGHTIFMDDTLGSEMMRIIDRAGQIIEFKCPVNTSVGQRKSGNAIDGGAKTQSEMAGDSWIKIVDLAGNTILVDSTSGNEKIEMTSKDGSKITIKDGVILNGGSAGILTHTTNPFDTFTGAPWPGSATELAS